MFNNNFDNCRDFSPKIQLPTTTLVKFRIQFSTTFSKIIYHFKIHYLNISIVQACININTIYCFKCIKFNLIFIKIKNNMIILSTYKNI